MIFQGNMGSGADLPRENFETFGWSLVTVFQVISPENWNQDVFDAYHGVGWGGGKLVVCVGCFCEYCHNSCLASCNRFHCFVICIVSGAELPDRCCLDWFCCFSVTCGYFVSLGLDLSSNLLVSQRAVHSTFCLQRSTW